MGRKKKYSTDEERLLARKESHKKYQENNREKISTYKRGYHQKNRDVIAEKKRVYNKNRWAKAKEVKQQQETTKKKLILEHVSGIDLFKLSAIHLRRYKTLMTKLDSGGDISKRHWDYLGKLVFDVDNLNSYS